MPQDPREMKQIESTINFAQAFIGKDGKVSPLFLIFGAAVIIVAMGSVMYFNMLENIVPEQPPNSPL